MADDFLLKEYEECFVQLRHYDDRLLSLLKFAITITSSMAGGLLAIYEIVDEKSLIFWLILSLVSACVFVGIFIITLGMVQIRLYYVHIARQLNAIREYQLNQSPEFKKKNQMYLTVNIPAFKWKSAQLLMIFGVSLLGFVYLSVAVSSFLFYLKNSIGYSLFIGFIFSLVMWGCNIARMKDYLVSMDKKPADEAIHGP